jgi:hypothetical protein
MKKNNQMQELAPQHRMHAFAATAHASHLGLQVILTASYALQAVEHANLIKRVDAIVHC